MKAKFGRESIVLLLASFKTKILTRIQTMILNNKKKEAIDRCKQYNCKYYVMQRSYFSFFLMRAGDVDLYKKQQMLDKNVTAVQLAKISAFIADPAHHNNKKKKK